MFESQVNSNSSLATILNDDDFTVIVFAMVKKNPSDETRVVLLSCIPKCAIRMISRWL